MKRFWLACCSALPLLAAAQEACYAAPLGGRALYLRGTFNSWGAADAQAFIWACNRYELVTFLRGEHSFKVADEAWSADADFGQGEGARLTPRGPEFKQRFNGVMRFTLAFKNGAADPELRTEECPAPTRPDLPVLYLRGNMNNWAALDDYAFKYSCDALYLNVKLSGTQEFKIADSAWSPAHTFSQNGGNFSQLFAGEQTLRLTFADGTPTWAVGPKTFADPGVKPVTDPVALSLRFDSRAFEHKSPFGAVVAGSALDFAVTALPGVEQLTLVMDVRRLEGNQEVLAYTEHARLPMQRTVSSDGRLERFGVSHRIDATGIYGYWFEAQIGGKTYVYQNNNAPVFWTREKGSGGVGAVTEKLADKLVDKLAYSSSIRRFRQTVYASHFNVPNWAADAVYYAIFPDRFRNGNRHNDPQPGVARYQNQTVELHKNWNERPFKPNSGDGTGDGSDATFNNDFFGGDLAGIIQKLDYIKSLGANTIYLTPVFKAASNHKYDTADYGHIDPAFGSDADFKRLTLEAKKRGLRVLPDTSLNHTGSDSVYFDRYGNHKSQGAFEGGRINAASPYASWYSFDASQTEPDKQFKGWVGVTDLPELNKASPAFRNFAYGAPNSVMKHWLNQGAAGWRMDVAPWVPDDFWREWRGAIKAHKPDAITVAETWFDASKYFLGDMFDSTMNYIFRNTVLEYAAGGDAQALYANLEHLREAYPQPALFAAMNLISSHDQARALHHFGWHNGPGEPTDAAQIALAKQRLKLAVLFQMIYPGAPSIYYGDEVGVTGGDDPYNRATYPWTDLGGKPDTTLLTEFKKLTRLRQLHAVLRRGSLDAPLFIDPNVVVLLRRLDPHTQPGAPDRWALTATNNASSPREMRLKLPAGAPSGPWRNALGGATLHVRDGELRVTVPALYGTVLMAR